MKAKKERIGCNSQSTIVVCIHCGTEMLRRPARPDAPRITWRCYTWHPMDQPHVLAHRCPGCGAITSLLSTREKVAVLRPQPLLALAQCRPGLTEQLGRAGN